MYEFIAHYVDMDTNKKHTKLITIDLCGLDSECMGGDNEVVFAWKQACQQAIELNTNGSRLFDAIELLGC